MKSVVTLLLICFLSFGGHAQVQIPSTLKQEHPRLLGAKRKSEIQKLIGVDEAARKAYEQAKQGIDSLVDQHVADPTWIVSRLQMYWKTRSRDVFIKGGVYDHAEGNAPVATVRFPGARDNVTIYAAPKLAAILPYSDDPRGIYLINKTKAGQPMEWAEISKTGRIIESINTQIMQLANTAALVYFVNGEEKYARFASDLFDTYLTGMYYRKLPYDVNHGHHQTITGLSTFEVIQEVAMLNSLVSIYDYLYDYLQKKSPEKMAAYSATFKKWADVQIQNGVAFNNWNLMQARNVLSIGSVLNDNNEYEDKKGRQYYIDQVINKSSERQWAITKLLNEGYDRVTGLWNESPGYSLGVLGDFIGFVTLFDKQYNTDILPQMPVLSKAVLAVAQYLFPNGYISSFGDSHYRRITTGAARELLINAQKNHKEKLEDTLTKFIKTMDAFYEKRGIAASSNDGHGGVRGGLASLLSGETTVQIKSSVTAGEAEEYITPVLYSDKVSYLALRNGLDPVNGLMVAMSGSKGNHMHAGGISMEIFGKGLVLGPESGIGTSYFQQDYAEYYSQFPAHNTVGVDGISNYPVMKSNHGFDLLSSYPKSGVSTGYFPRVSYADLYFVEPETMSDQNRLTSIIRTSDSSGYYVDIFRSKRKDGKDKMHDYFYHNLGQQLTLTSNTGKPLNLTPTDKLSFSGGHLFAYDYFWDKKSITTKEDFNAAFKLSVRGREEVTMNMWMKGAADREIFSVKAPPSKAFGGNAMIPDSIAALPMPTIVARQSGEAWKRPFVAVFEPTASAGKSVSSINSFTPAKAANDFVGLVIESKTGHQQYIYSATNATNEVSHKQQTFAGTYGVISYKNNDLDFLFLGNGKKISAGDYSITANTDTASSTLSKEKDGWYFTSNESITVTFPADLFIGNTSIKIGGKTVAGRKASLNGKVVISFAMPQVKHSKIEW